MTRPTVHILVTQDLGYCCLWFFLTRFRQTRVVADRLGVSDEAVKQHRRKVRCGATKCEARENCMHAKVTMQLRPRKARGEDLG